MTELAPMLAMPLAVFAVVYGAGYLRRPRMNHGAARGRLARYEAGGRVTVPVLMMRSPASPSSVGNVASVEVSWQRRFEVTVYSTEGTGDEPSDWGTARLGPLWALVRDANRTPSDADTRRVRLRALGPTDEWLLAQVQDEDLCILDRAAASYIGE